MKTICAWCGSTIAVCCEHCGAPLVPTRVTGASIPFLERDAMCCTNGLTPILYTADAIRRMPETYGLCRNCAALPKTEREARLISRRNADPRLPSAADLDAICAEREQADKHEAETRSINRQKTALEKRPNEPPQKRGPTGVTRSATTHAKTITGKDEQHR